jgi:hypothetical protein
MFIFLIKDVRQLSNLNSDYQDRKRNSLRDNNNKQIGNKRLFNSDQSSRNDQRHESPTSKRRRINNTNDNITIEDEYHEYEKNKTPIILFIFY